MAEFQFECAAAESQAAQLVAQADSENRHAAEQLADICDGVGDRLGIAGAVREKNAVRLQRENIFGGSFRRNDGDVAAVIHEKAQNILLDAEIVGDDAIARAAARRGCSRGVRQPWLRRQRAARLTQRPRSIEPCVHSYFFARRDAAGEFLARHRGQRASFGDQFFGGSAVGCDDAAQRADIAQMAHQRARINDPR